MSGLELLATELVRDLTGRLPGAIAPIAQGVMTYKFLAEYADERYVIRIYPLGREQAGLIEAAFLGRCREAGMLTPEVLGASDFGGMRSIIYRYIAGSSLQDAPVLNREAMASLATEIAEQLRILGDLPAAGFGDLVSASSGAHQTLQSHLVTTAVRALEARTKLPPPLNEIANRMAAWTPKSFAAHPPQLIWGDISPENIIVSPQGSLAGLVDFEGVLIAGRAATLGFLEARYPDDVFTGALRRALAGASAPPASATYSYTVLRALRLWPFLAEPLPTGLARGPVESVLPGLAPAVASLLDTELDFEG